MAGKKRCAYVPPAPAPASDADADANTEVAQQPERCKSRAVAFAGDCSLCEASFCSQHRYPEHHDCPNREAYLKLGQERFANKLMGEQTVARKIVAV
ncbi:hypothetical protein SCHPADRAFT_853743 [Schizopora paradoxa]|uniref:AN1-type domain-containing protein n=1 Tax=Schizopora paradoxa TaxID=27342 RepID=A0A0H2S711_9AGAM|nr:hypothetical protein SCHPADRAFT_853743 [Schizopora paradoxa]